MNVRKAPAFSLLILILLLSSGCLHQQEPQLKVSQQEIILEGNQTKQLGIRVKNNYNTTESFNATITPEKTQNQYIKILKSGEEKADYDLGDAAADSHTSWKYVKLQGIPENVDASAIAIDLKINAYQNGFNGSVDNKTIPVTVAKDQK